jgi:hypothetical protein
MLPPLRPFTRARGSKSQRSAGLRAAARLLADQPETCYTERTIDDGDVVLFLRV